MMDRATRAIGAACLASGSFQAALSWGIPRTRAELGRVASWEAGSLPNVPDCEKYRLEHAAVSSRVLRPPERGEQAAGTLFPPSLPSRQRGRPCARAGRMSYIVRTHQGSHASWESPRLHSPSGSIVGRNG